MSLSKVLQDVAWERKQQDIKWGEDRDLHPFEWLVILGEEYGESCQASLDCIKGGPALLDLRKELIQTAAVAVAAVESIDRTIQKENLAKICSGLGEPRIPTDDCCD